MSMKTRAFSSHQVSRCAGVVSNGRGDTSRGVDEARPIAHTEGRIIR